MSRYAWSDYVNDGDGGRQETASVLEAAKEWKKQCLKGNGSMFFEGRRIWTPQNFEILRKRYNEAPDTSEEDFMEKLEGQLRPLHETNQDDVIILMAEILWFMFLPQSYGEKDRENKNRGDINVKTRKEYIHKILNWANIQNLEHVNRLIDKSYKNYIANLAPGYNLNRWDESTYAIRLLHKLKNMGENIDSLLDDHIKLAAFCDRLAAEAKPQFRHVILYLLFPDERERIFSRGKRELIVKEWKKNPGKMTLSEMDAKIAEIRKELKGNAEIKKWQRDERQEDLDFYQPWIRAKWDSEYAEEHKTEETGTNTEASRPGPVPSESITGYFVIRDPNKLASTYLLRFGNHDMWKVGWAHNAEKRCADINKHIPHELLDELPDLRGCCWTLHKIKRRANARSAQRLEQAILGELKDKGWTTDTERAKCTEDEILEIWREKVKEHAMT